LPRAGPRSSRQVCATETPRTPTPQIGRNTRSIHQLALESSSCFGMGAQLYRLVMMMASHSATMAARETTVVIYIYPARRAVLAWMTPYTQTRHTCTSCTAAADFRIVLWREGGLCRDLVRGLAAAKISAKGSYPPPVRTGRSVACVAPAVGNKGPC
jgi:hypothetical protein